MQQAHASIAAVFSELGIRDWGAASAGHADAEAEARLAAWLADGRHGKMSWLERHAAEKFHPEKILQGCRTVLVAAFSCYQNDPPEASSVAQGRIARHARGRRYQNYVVETLQAAAKKLERAFPEESFLVGCDDIPLAEKHYAVRAGLGFIGRHGLLIHPRLGSFLVLGEILTTMSIANSSETPAGPADCHSAPDPGCGSCRRCLEACPSGALDTHGLDTRRCLSALTIEGRGAFPAELAPLLGDRLFGCDRCQEVCPHNGSIEETPHHALREACAGPTLPLAEVLALADDAALKARFPQSGLVRAKRAGLVRNACLVAANTGRLELLPMIARLADDREPGVAAAAALAIKLFSEIYD